MANHPNPPDGYRYLEVILEVSDAEYRRLTSERAITAPGTYGAAVRTKMGWPARPYGLKSAIKKMRG